MQAYSALRSLRETFHRHNLLHHHLAAAFASQPALKQPDASQGKVLQSYLQDVEQGLLRPDGNQAACIEQLDDLCNQLPQYAQAVETYEQALATYKEHRERKRKELIRREEEEARRQQQRDQQQQDRQEGIVSRLRQFLGASEEPSETPPAQLAISSAQKREAKLEAMVGPPPQAPQMPKGVYIYGSVGSGKSMIMDRFYDVVQREQRVPRFRRMHFNAALLEVHSRLHKLEAERLAMDHKQMEAYAQQVALRDLRNASRDSDNAEAADQLAQDPMREKQKDIRRAKLAIRRMLRSRLGKSQQAAAASLARSNAIIFSRAAASLIRARDGDMQLGWEPSPPTASLLCFDEVQVNDPFSALALKGIFEALSEEGTVIVATSNRAPWDLNRHGVHEDLFTHFQRHLLSVCHPFHLSAETDYRRLLGGAQGAVQADGPFGRQYLYPLSEATSSKLENQWQGAIAADGGAPVASADVPVMFGRVLQVEEASGGVARFRFEELCKRALGSADYMALAQRFHTVFLTGIPVMSLQSRDQARRFITLVDELYNARTRLVCTAEALPEQLFAGAADDAPVVDLESLQFEGAVEGGRLRRNVMEQGGVAPVFAKDASMGATAQLGGLEEKFAFQRAVSRIHEMESDQYVQSRSRGLRPNL